jgi:hypothetical protein
MNSNRQNKSRKSPFVRFLRGIVRLFKVVFGAKRKNLKSPEDYQQELRLAELGRRERESEELGRRERKSEEQSRQQLTIASEQASEKAAEQFITVGELFERVKWQGDRAMISQLTTIDPVQSTRIQSAALN